MTWANIAGVDAGAGGLLRLNAGIADDLGPALGLLLLELRHVLRAAARGHQVELAETRLGVRLVDNVVDGAVELGDDRSRGLGRRADGVPGVRNETGQTDLDQGRDVRQAVEPLLGRHRKDPGLA